MPRKVKFMKQYKPIPFGDGPDLTGEPQQQLVTAHGLNTRFHSSRLNREGHEIGKPLKTKTQCNEVVWQAKCLIHAAENQQIFRQAGSRSARAVLHVHGGSHERFSA
jgi:hypothetical protein